MDDADDDSNGAIRGKSKKLDGVTVKGIVQNAAIFDFDTEAFEHLSFEQTRRQFVECVKEYPCSVVWCLPEEDLGVLRQMKKGRNGAIRYESQNELFVSVTACWIALLPVMIGFVL